MPVRGQGWLITETGRRLPEKTGQRRIPTGSTMTDDMKLFLWIIADAGALVLASMYLTWRIIRRANKRAGAGGKAGCAVDDALLIARSVTMIGILWWGTIAVKFPGQVRAQSAKPTNSSEANEAAHARFEEQAKSTERRLTKLEAIPEIVAGQKVEMIRMRDELADLRKSVDDLISLQRNLFVGILLAVVAAAIQLFERWTATLKKRGSAE